MKASHHHIKRKSASEAHITLAVSVFKAVALPAAKRAAVAAAAILVAGPALNAIAERHGVAVDLAGLDDELVRQLGRDAEVPLRVDGRLLHVADLALLGVEDLNRKPVVGSGAELVLLILDNMRRA